MPSWLAAGESTRLLESEPFIWKATRSSMSRSIELENARTTLL